MLSNTISSSINVVPTPLQIEEWAAIIQAVKAICESAAGPEAKMRLITRIITEPYKITYGGGNVGAAGGFNLR